MCRKSQEIFEEKEILATKKVLSFNYTILHLNSVLISSLIRDYASTKTLKNQIQQSAKKRKHIKVFSNKKILCNFVMFDLKNVVGEFGGDWVAIRLAQSSDVNIRAVRQFGLVLARVIFCKNKRWQA